MFLRACFGIEITESARLFGFIGEKGRRYGTPKDSFFAKQMTVKQNEIVMPGKPKNPARKRLRNLIRTMLFIKSGTMKVQTADSEETMITGALARFALIAASPSISPATMPTALPTALGILRLTSRISSNIMRIVMSSPSTPNGTSLLSFMMVLYSL